MIKSEIARFTFKVIAFFLAWYVIYDWWLLPEGHLDAWLAVNLTHTTAGVLKTLGYDVYVIGRLIGIDQEAGIYLLNGSMGISAMGLFVGFILIYPGGWIPEIIYIVMGLGIIYLANILHVAVLVLAQESWPGLFSLMHDYSTTGIFYFLVFIMWAVWIYSGEGIRTRTPPRQC